MESITASRRAVSHLCFHFFLIFLLATFLFVEGFKDLRRGLEQESFTLS